ncbi:2'-5' RNA ligase [Georgenia soli]|uniref:2'-5' RNA ligase n=2 Tax=Georgenia soli TaxID=638953 RepID=A0A2A9EL84_9MICO|nr:2'-5' RNA ligase [Georgenia soli]
MRDHFARTDLRAGQAELTWHLLIEDPEVVRTLARWRGSLAGAEHLAPVADEGLHLTMQVVGLLDALPADAPARVASAVRDRLRGLGPVTVELTRPEVVEDGVVVGVRDDTALQQLRAAIRAGVADAGLEISDGDDWWPHVTLAYSTTEATGESTREALAVAAEDPAGPPALTVQRVSLLAQRMEPPTYVWDVLDAVELSA